MKIEDYNEYYIQGTDHYLIPKDNFEELFNEMVNWKEESQNLKKQVKIKEDGFKASTEELCEYAEENQELKSQLSNGHQIKNQQKEFIEYLENEINELTLSWRDASYIPEEILSKYKEIIGGKE